MLLTFPVANDVIWVPGAVVSIVAAMSVQPALLAVTLVGTILRITAQLGAPPTLATLILAGPAVAVFLGRILRPPQNPAMTTLASKAHWNLPGKLVKQETPV